MAETQEQERAALKRMDSSHIHVAFYYELELWDRVIEREDGERLGIRIRQVGQ